MIAKEVLEYKSQQQAVAAAGHSNKQQRGSLSGPTRDQVSHIPHEAEEEPSGAMDVDEELRMREGK